MKRLSTCVPPAGIVGMKSVRNNLRLEYRAG